MTITTIRTFESTHTELGVGLDDTIIPGVTHDIDGDRWAKSDRWFVFDRQPNEAWHLHCGPYATREEAEGWITGIREV